MMDAGRPPSSQVTTSRLEHSEGQIRCIKDFIERVIGCEIWLDSAMRWLATGIGGLNAFKISVDGSADHKLILGKPSTTADAMHCEGVLYRPPKTKDPFRRDAQWRDGCWMVFHSQIERGVVIAVHGGDFVGDGLGHDLDRHETAMNPKLGMSQGSRSEDCKNVVIFGRAVGYRDLGVTEPEVGVVELPIAVGLTAATALHSQKTPNS